MIPDVNLEPTIYVVTGMMRSFTSMMMRCLLAGGMGVVYDEEQNKVAEEQYELTGHHPNPDGLFEPLQKTRAIFTARPYLFKGYAIKLLCNYGYCELPNWDGAYRVLLMTRNPAEIRQSYQRGFNKPLAYVNKDTEEEIGLTDEMYGHLIRIVQRQLDHRNDIRWSVIDGKSLIENPFSVFSRMQEIGWPIDPLLASNIVDPKKYRERLPVPAQSSSGE